MVLLEFSMAPVGQGESLSAPVARILDVIDRSRGAKFGGPGGVDAVKRTERARGVNGERQCASGRADRAALHAPAAVAAGEFGQFPDVDRDRLKRDNVARVTEPAQRLGELSAIGADVDHQIDREVAQEVAQLVFEGTAREHVIA